MEDFQEMEKNNDDLNQRLGKVEKDMNTKNS